jgi:hypothetical protein
MKGGGVGYIQPAPDMFPSVDELHELTVGCSGERITDGKKDAV